MNRIEQLRKENNLTQEELARKLNMSKSIIALYESNQRNPSVDVLIKLSKIFDCSVDYLLGKTNIQNIKFANSGGLDTTGLDKDEIEELKKQVEFMKWKKSNGTK